MASHFRNLSIGTRRILFQSRHLAALFLLAALLAGCAGAPDERLWVDAKINGIPARLFVDTGSSSAMLVRGKAEALGLKITDRPRGLNITDPCALEIWNTTITTRLVVDEMPPYVKLDMDGVVGWAQLRGKILRFDASARLVTPLDQLPADLAGWTKLRVRPSPQMMTLEVPSAAGGPPGLIFVDTGNPGGVGLSPAHWAQWRTAHLGEPATLRLYFTPSARDLHGPQTNPATPGTVVAEEMWAHDISLGPLDLTETPVGESDPATARLGGPRHLATLGMAALRRLDFIYDGQNDCVYLRPKSTPPTPYLHNRLGAVFTAPDDIHDYLVAHVEPGGPADRAGLRNGDQLTTLNGRTHLNSLIHPEIGMFNFEWPWVSAVYLRVQRGDQELHINLLLENILGPPMN
jgi:hypothetical protein